MTFTLLLLFSAGYCCIALERTIKIGKAWTALFTGVLCWIAYSMYSPDTTAVVKQLVARTGDFSPILFFLLGAMTIVELIDLHRGFDLITNLITVRGGRALLWTIALVTFFLSAILDNLTTTIVICSLLTKLVADRRDRLLFASIVVIAANAGGAWSPIGDITTTMLWMGGQITSGKMIPALILPCLVNLAVPVLIASFSLRGKSFPPSDKGEPARPTSAMLVTLFTGLGVLVAVPVFKVVTGLPPFMGMLIGVAVFAMITDLMHHKKSDEERSSLSIARALERIDLQTIMFFLGILLCIAALDASGILSGLALRLDRAIGNPHHLAFGMGILSAIVDNVPLVAASMGMYDVSRFCADHPFWLFLSYCVGTGGSLLVIGSAAGVAAMGMAKIDFFWYVKRILPLALCGYAAGAGVFLAMEAILK